MVIAGLLLVCVAKGLWVTAGVQVPPDPDTVRDLGFIQGFLDGNWFGDPATAGAWRWYPPLLHGLAALLVGAFGVALLPVWLHAGVWLNLLCPLMFYLMNRRLIGAWPGAAATVVLVLVSGLVMASDAVIGYTPWTLTPGLAWPLFFGAVWLIAARIERLRMSDAMLLGGVLGLVFLAHTVPAVLLSGMVASAAVAVGGFRWRTLLWLMLVAGVQLVCAMPFLGPLIADYHLHIVNPAPGAWVHPALREKLTLLPNLFGAGILGWLLWRRAWVGLPPASVAMIGTWIGLCVAFLARHYACSAAGEAGGVCGVFVVAPHHYHAYLQAAWASLAGLAIGRWDPPRLLLGCAGLALLGVLFGFLTRPEDLALQRLGSTRPELIMDLAAYDWILGHTAPSDLFVTELPPGGEDMGPAAATVLAAGRRLVAPPELHANPYLGWAERNARRLGDLRALSVGGGDPCRLWTEAAGGVVLFLLPNDAVVASGGVTAVFRDQFLTIYTNRC
jgi:hypothetical protein